MKKNIFCFLLLFTLSLNIYSQDDGLPPDPEQFGPPDDGLPPDPEQFDPPPAPIDDGLSVLLLFGVSYVAWRFINNKDVFRKDTTE